MSLMSLRQNFLFISLTLILLYKNTLNNSHKFRITLPTYLPYTHVTNKLTEPNTLNHILLILVSSTLDNLKFHIVSRLSAKCQQVR